LEKAKFRFRSVLDFAAVDAFSIGHQGETFAALLHAPRMRDFKRAKFDADQTL